jgi:hypothetical protein
MRVPQKWIPVLRSEHASLQDSACSAKVDTGFAVGTRITRDSACSAKVGIGRDSALFGQIRVKSRELADLDRRSMMAGRIRRLYDG